MERYDNQTLSSIRPNSLVVWVTYCTKLVKIVLTKLVLIFQNLLGSVVLKPEQVKEAFNGLVENGAFS